MYGDNSCLAKAQCGVNSGFHSLQLALGRSETRILIQFPRTDEVGSLAIQFFLRLGEASPSRLRGYTLARGSTSSKECARVDVL